MHMQVDEIISLFQDTWLFVFWYTAHTASVNVLCCCACCFFPVYRNCQQGFTCMQDLWLWLSVFWTEWLIMLKLHQTCYYNSVQFFVLKFFLFKLHWKCVKLVCQQIKVLYLILPHKFQSRILSPSLWHT